MRVFRPKRRDAKGIIKDTLMESIIEIVKTHWHKFLFYVFCRNYTIIPMTFIKRKKY